LQILIKCFFTTKKIAQKKNKRDIIEIYNFQEEINVVGV